jgi:hypothetical protein
MKEFNDLYYVRETADSVIRTLHDKREEYGDSWRARGGQGAFFTTVRKFDRIEHSAKQCGYDVFAAFDRFPGEDGFEASVHDTIGYLLLWLAHHRARKDQHMERAVMNEHNAAEKTTLP